MFSKDIGKLSLFVRHTRRAKQSESPNFFIPVNAPALIRGPSEIWPESL
mgnify:FL=1